MEAALEGLKKQYKSLAPKDKNRQKTLIAGGLGIILLLVSFFGIREAMYDPLAAMNLERQSLFGKQFGAQKRSGAYSRLSEHMAVIVQRDNVIWQEIERRWKKGDKREGDFDKVTNELIPGRLEVARRLREEGNYVAAVKALDWVLKIYETMAQADSAEYVDVFKMQAENYLALNDFTAAYKYYEKAYQIASRTMSSYGKQGPLMDLLYVMMEINVHEGNYIAALAQAEKLKRMYQAAAVYQNIQPIAKRDWLALLSEEAEIERISNSRNAITAFKTVVACWESFIKSNRTENQYQIEEYLARSRYGLALAQAETRDFASAAANMEAAYAFFKEKGKDPELTERIRKNYLALLRKTDLAAFMSQSLRS